MKKLTIILLALFFVGITNINAQTDAITTDEVTTDEVKKECPFTKTADGKLICTKTGKICDPASCKNKSKCCKGKSKRSSCSKSKKGGFNYNKSNNYGNKTSSKCNAKKIKKCGDDCIKACCAKEEEATEENDESSDE